MTFTPQLFELEPDVDLKLQRKKKRKTRPVTQSFSDGTSLHVGNLSLLPLRLCYYKSHHDTIWYESVPGVGEDPERRSGVVVRQTVQLSEELDTALHIYIYISQKKIVP